MAIAAATPMKIRTNGSIMLVLHKALPDRDNPAGEAPRAQPDRKAHRE